MQYTYILLCYVKHAPISVWGELTVSVYRCNIGHKHDVDDVGDDVVDDDDVVVVVKSFCFSRMELAKENEFELSDWGFVSVERNNGKLLLVKVCR